MPTLTSEQIMQYASQAGFSGSSLATITAIALAESGGATDIRGHSDPRDRGLVQINSYWHPEVSDQCAFDPACAMRAAYTISNNGSNFSQWVTYTTGAYKAHLTDVPSSSGGGCPWYCQIPTGIAGQTFALPGADCSGCKESPTNMAVGAIGQAIANPFSWLTGSDAWGWLNNPMRMAKIIIGLAITGIGIFMLAKG